MNRPEALHLLTRWQERMQDANDNMDALAQIIGCTPESPLQSAIYGLMGDYTQQVADRIGCSTEWLEAWWLDHNFGERPMSAGIVGEPLRDISTLEDLVALIVGDAAKADQEAGHG
jgi:hypothetical protein